jgi:hypothetical protein
MSAQVFLGWDPNAVGDNVLGYKIYEGTQSGVYTEVVDVGNVTTGFVVLFTNGLYFFALTAYNAIGESSKSFEIFGNFIVIQSPAPTRMMVG